MKLSDIANSLGEEFHGNGEIQINSISSPSNVNKDSICLITSEHFISHSLSDASAILCKRNLTKLIPNENFIISENPLETFAKLTKIFFVSPSMPNHNKEKNIHLGLDVCVGSNFTSGVGVIIEDNVVIGDNVVLGHNVVIHKDVIISNNVEIGSGTVVGSEGFGNILSSDKSWKHISHLGSVFIHDNVSIGANCSIDRGTIDNTIINQGVIIDNQVHIAHNVVIGENTAIAAKVGIAGSCFIGKRNMIGGMVGIVDHIKTADDVIISATSTVNKDIKEPGTYTGIMPISNHANWKRIALWITKLDKISKFLNLKRSKLL